MVDEKASVCGILWTFVRENILEVSRMIGKYTILVQNVNNKFVLLYSFLYFCGKFVAYYAFSVKWERCSIV